MHIQPYSKSLLLLAALTLLLTGCFELGKPVDETAQIVDETASQPEVVTLTADQLRSMLDDAHGTVVVANFWATWCPPCVEEMPELVTFYNAHHGKGVTFLSLSVDHPATIEEAVRPFIEKHNLPFTVYVVDEQDPGAVTEKTGLELLGAVPVTWVIDRDGHPVRSWVEKTTVAELEGAIQPLLTEELTQIAH